MKSEINPASGEAPALLYLTPENEEDLKALDAFHLTIEVGGGVCFWENGEGYGEYGKYLTVEIS
jgi:hypothetical protein